MKFDCKLILIQCGVCIHCDHLSTSCPLYEVRGYEYFWDMMPPNSYSQLGDCIPNPCPFREKSSARFNGPTAVQKRGCGTTPAFGPCASHSSINRTALKHHVPSRSVPLSHKTVKHSRVPLFPFRVRWLGESRMPPKYLESTLPQRRREVHQLSTRECHTFQNAWEY